MHFKTFAAILTLSLSMTASAAVIPFKLPATLGGLNPMILPGVSAPALNLPGVNSLNAIATLTPTLNASVLPAPSPISLPSRPAPAIEPVRLPSAPSALPVPVPVKLDDIAPAKTTTESLNDLRDTVLGRDPIRMPGNLFDGRRETMRELELPSNRYL